MNNMRKYAILNNDAVEEVKSLDEAGVQEVARRSQLVLDVHDLLIQPQSGWILVGNQLQPPPSQALDLPSLVRSRIKFYQDQAPELLRELYTENTLLGITTAQSDQMFEDFKDVLIRLREGAWPTALYRLAQKQPSGFVTQTMIDRWAALITSRML
jgi:hypothetical protein